MCLCTTVPYLVQMPTPDTQVTTAEAANLLHASVWTVQRLVKSGALTPTKKLPGRRGAYLFDRAAVEALAAERNAE